MDFMESAVPQFTGRVLMVGKPGESSETVKNMKKEADLSIASSRDYNDQEVPPEALSEGDGIFLDEIGITILTVADSAQLERAASVANIAADADGPIMEPEQIMFALQDGFEDYLRGFRDAAAALADKFAGTDHGAQEMDETGITSQVSALFTNATWGLKATRTVVSPPLTQRFSGKGIKVCVLDTGMDLNHPDFAGRNIVSRSFIAGEAVDDRHGHGTHCVGTACGPKSPASGVQRYGVAYESDIFVGKVLSNAGSGPDGGILAGINWALGQRCHVISMSLGSIVDLQDGSFSQVYENAARAALAAGTLIVAASGNDSRPVLHPVSRPANCPSIMAVASVDRNMRRAASSNVTFFPPQGKVDIAGPGVDVFSSIPVHLGKHGNKSGTSMATPHVSGIAALHAQANPGHLATQLWQRLIATANALAQQPAGHVGAGLVQAPWERIAATQRSRQVMEEILSGAQDGTPKPKGKTKAHAKA